MKSPQSTPTALLVIDVQLGLTHPTFAGPSRSTPSLESNLTTLLGAARSHNAANKSSPIHIIHIHHHSHDTTSLLHPSHIVDWSPNPQLNGQPGISPLPCALPLEHEPVLTKSVNSAFIGTDLEARLRALGVKQVLVTGMTTEHCVSTTVRMAANLNVVGDPEGMGERGVVLIEDGCAAFGMERGGKEVFTGDQVQRLEVEVLRYEFCECLTTENVVACIQKAE